MAQVEKGRPHPGLRHKVRRFHSAPAPLIHLRADLPAGRDLQSAIFAVLATVKCQAANVSVFGGGFSKFSFTTGDVETRADSAKQSNYTYFRHWERVDLILGAVTAGLDVNGAPLVHCHALFVGESGEETGGHLSPDQCVIARPITAQIAAHPQALVQQAFDEETTHTIFNPVTRQRAP